MIDTTQIVNKLCTVAWHYVNPQEHAELLSVDERSLRNVNQSETSVTIMVRLGGPSACNEGRAEPDWS